MPKCSLARHLPWERYDPPGRPFYVRALVWIPTSLEAVLNFSIAMGLGWGLASQEETLYLRAMEFVWGPTSRLGML